MATGTPKLFESNEETNRFWELVHLAADYARRAQADDAYYAAGYCGGCSTCGDPPYDVHFSELEEVVEGFRQLFEPHLQPQTGVRARVLVDGVWEDEAQGRSSNPLNHPGLQA